MRYLFLSLAVVFTSAGTDAHSLSGKLRADGTEFVLSLSDGRTLRGADVIGMQLVVQHHSEAVSIRIEGVSEEAKAAGGAVFLYRASVHEPGGSSHDLCLPDAAGRRAGFPIPNEKGWFSFSCTSGVEAKCVLMGYRPWERHPSGASMRDLHKTCIHLMRADYGGDDQPTTRDGTSVNVEDRFGIQTFDDVEGMTFEAAWASMALSAWQGRASQATSPLKFWRSAIPAWPGRLGRRRVRVSGWPAMQGFFCSIDPIPIRIGPRHPCPAGSADSPALRRSRGAPESSCPADWHGVRPSGR